MTTRLNIHHLCEVAEMREPFDLVFLVVKAYDTRWHCELIRPLLAPDGLAVGVQNGMTLDDMAAVLGPERTLGSVIEIAGNMFEPGVVERQTPRSGTWFALGAYDEAAARARGGGGGARCATPAPSKSPTTSARRSG